MMKRVEELFEWAVKQNLMKDSKRIAKLYDEARRRWSLTRYETSKIIEATLDKLKEKECGE